MQRSEEFRIAPSGPIAFGILGCLTLIFAADLVTRSAGDAWSRPVPLIILTVFAAGGVGLLWAAIRQARFRLVVDHAGVHLPTIEGPIPFGQIVALKSTPFGLGIRLLDHEARTLGVIPGQIREYRRALLLISLGMERGGGREVETRFEGSHGWLGLLGLVVGVAYLFREFDPRAVDGLRLAPAIVAAGLLAVGLYKIIQLWRGTGMYELAIDGQGLRLRGRGGEWEHRWGEVKSVEAILEPGRGMPVSVRVITTEDEIRLIPLRGVELHGVLQALRAFGGPAARSLTPPADRPEIPLLKRSF
jgi:hypothetical protein